METTRIRTQWRPFKHRVELELDTEELSLFRRKFPYFGKMKKYSSFPIDDLIYWCNNASPNSSRWMYVCEDGSYESLPVSSSQEAADDKDDWLFNSLPNREGDESELIKDSDEALDADLYMYTATTRLKIGSKQIEHLFSILKNTNAVKATVRHACGLLLKQYIAYTDKWLFHLNKDESDSTPLKEMAFFVKNKKNLYCGYHRQLNVKIVNPNLFKEIRDLCYSKSKRLTASGTTYKTGLLHPDIITLTDTAIVYTRKTFRKDEMAYVPYKRVNMLFKSQGLFTTRISVFGEQNIIPNHSFKKSIANTIVAILKQHGLGIKTGKTFHSSLIAPKNWFGRAPRIVCMDDGIVFYPNRIKGGDNQLIHTRISYSDIDKVKWYRKLFAFFGTIVIEGSYNNIREDQSSSAATIVIPLLSAFKYKWFLFSGKLRKILKNKTSADFERIRESFHAIK